MPKPRETVARSDYRRSLDQLRKIETQLSEISSENARLKAKLRRSQEEVREWGRFAGSVMEQIRGGVRFTGDFPNNDGPAQRFILSDLLRKLSSIRETDVVEHPEYRWLAQECAATKEKLREVTRRCDQMLAIIRSRGYGAGTSTTRGAPHALHSFRTHVRQLDGLAQEIKRDFKRARGCDDDLDC
jgi:hypothetical protein